MRNNFVHFPDLHVGHHAKCFLLCVYSYLYRQQPDNFISSHKFQPMGGMSLEERGQAVGFIQARASLRQIRNYL